MLRPGSYLALGDGVAAEVGARARPPGRRSGRARPRHLLAHARLLQNDPQGALAEAATVRPAHAAYAARIRGRAFMALGDGAGALAEFDRALALAPDDSAVWTDVAALPPRQRRRRRRARAADRAVAAGPRNVEALVLRGELTRGQYGLAAALPWFDRALEVDPDNIAGSARARRSPMAIWADAATCSPTRGTCIASPAAIPRLITSRRCSPRAARNFELARSLYNRTGGAFDADPAGDAARRARSISRPAMSSRRPGG